MRSYAAGPTLPLLEKTIGQAFEDTVSNNPDGDALISRHQGLRLTYRELKQNAERAARGLWWLGIRPGDRVGVWAPNLAEWIYLQLAAAASGAILVNVNPAYRSHELGFVLRKSRMKTIFLTAGDSRVDYLKVLDEARQGPDAPPARSVVFGSDLWDRMLGQTEAPPPASMNPDDAVNIQYTSGTTGTPKGVLLTHRNLVNNADIVARALRIGTGDRLCSPVPLYHCFGCVMSSLLSFVSGAALVLPAAQFDARATLEAIADERCTAVYGVPTMFIAELDHRDFAGFDLTSLRTGLMAGAPCPIEIMKRVTAEMHCPEMTIAYGQTESSPAITMSAADDSLEARVSTVGRPLANTEVKIVAPWNREMVEAGQDGELCARGYLVMKGYDGEPEATAHAVDEEGWLHTGDLARMRPDGRFHISGRLKEMIIRGGENIYPREIEEFLHGHGKIADVYVVGLPDEKLGESVAAWIRLRAGESMTAEDVRTYCGGRIAHFKIPQYIRFVDAFPMTATGKVQKFRIREAEIEARGLERASSMETA